MTDEHITSDAISFGGDNGAEFFDEMANAVSGSLHFEQHGPLDENERIAFQWGFRHGVFLLRALMLKAAERDEQTQTMISHLTDEATREWSLKVRLNMDVIFSDFPTTKTRQ